MHKLTDCTSRMTESQFQALAKLIVSRGGPAKEAARLVLVEGKTNAEAVAITGLSHQGVWNAVKRYSDGFEQARKVVASGDGLLFAKGKDMSESKWLPIADAPRDGTAVLVMRDIWPGLPTGRAEKCNGHNTYVAAWWAGESDGQGAWVCYMDKVLDPLCPIEPTHFMPLPPPPAFFG